MMNPVSLLIRLLAGVALGLFFFGGLWLTIRYLGVVRHPGVLALSSFWIRTLAVAAVFLPLAADHWVNALVCLFGFTLGRVAIVKLLPDLEAKPRCT